MQVGTVQRKEPASKEAGGSRRCPLDRRAEHFAKDSRRGSTDRACNPDSRRERRSPRRTFANFSSRTFMPARKDGTEIATSFKVAMNDLTGLNPLRRKFLSGEEEKTDEIIDLLRESERERAKDGENTSDISVGGSRVISKRSTSSRVHIR